ncbi:MAG: carboxypeptidase regulatory-like domain-containing protein [Bacteroidaceae bacterium]|nr:carboxypeptidase regulatory-like domain-containing protein [Bacteroidaceae bacterium]
MKTVFKYLPVVVALFLLISCEEDNYTTSSAIYGTVIESTDNTPIEGVVVTNQTTGKNCITKEDGRYEFQNLEFGKTYKIYAEKDGYIPSSQSITSSEVRDKIELNIKLKKRP